MRQRQQLSGPGGDDIRSVLVIAWGLLGDAFCMLPALAALRARLPSARIVVWTDAPQAPVFDGQEVLDELWLFEGRDRGLRNALRHWPWLRRVHRSGFDLVVDFYASRASARYARLARRLSAGRNRPRVRAHYDVVPQRADAAINATEPLPALFAAVVAELGAVCSTPYVRLRLDPAARELAARILVYAGLCEGEPLTLLNPATSNAAKTWSPERFGELARGLARHGVRVAVLCNPGHEEQQIRVLRAAGGAGVALPPLTLQTVAALIEKANLFVSGDTGLTHVAAAHGTPCIVPAGPTRPSTFIVAPDLVTALFDGASCLERAPAHDCAKQKTCAHRSCIGAIDADAVLAACVRRLGVVPVGRRPGVSPFPARPAARPAPAALLPTGTP